MLSAPRRLKPNPDSCAERKLFRIADYFSGLLGDESLDWSGCGLSVDTVQALIEQAHQKVTEPGTLLPPHLQFQALLDETGLVRATA